LILLALFVAACGSAGGGNPTQRPTARPTATFTPRSTELPLVPTTVLVGSQEKPIKIILVGEAEAATNRAIRSLEQAFDRELDTFKLGYYDGLNVEIELVKDNSEAIYRLCNSNDTIAFVDAFTFIAAEKQCGVRPIMQVERDGERGSNFELAVFEQRVFDLRSMRGLPFCTLDMNDLTGFIHPALAFRAAGVDPLDDFSEIKTDFESEADIVIAITGRYEPSRQPACDAAAFPVGTLDRLEPELVNEDAERPLTQPQFNTVGILQPPPDQSWSPIPYPILVAPPDRLFPDFLLDAVVTAIEGIESDAGSAQEELNQLVPHDALVRASPSNYNAFRSFLERAGWNMAESITTN
jgi:hypothetical protein